MALPGGDDFGDRPIDMHLKGLEALGASFELSAEAEEATSLTCGMGPAFQRTSK